MRFDTKIAVLVSDDLATWQKLNVACFLAGGLAGAYPEITGEAYRDADGGTYAPLIRQPVLVFAATGDELRRTLQRARERGVTAAIYTQALFATGNDVDNRAAVAAVAGADLDLVGIGLHAPRNVVDKICKGLALHG
jgi:hypothetical protein